MVKHPANTDEDVIINEYAEDDKPYTDPATYPAPCDISQKELKRLKEYFEDDETDLGVSVHGGWPPTDELGNAYQIWFTVDDLDARSRLLDSNWNPYPPFSGNLEPVERDEWTCCNAPLNNWRDRYPSLRLCGAITKTDENGDRYDNCRTHKRPATMKSAEEQLQTGLFTKTVDHLYDKLSPWKKLIGWGTFESLMGESTYEYGVEYREDTLDFSESEYKPADVDEDDILSLKMGYPTQRIDGALSLYVAAMKTVQLITVQPRIMYENVEEGEGMMESKTIEKAQLTAPPSEHDPSPQQFKTIETWNEHHLNLPMSRLITDRPKLLERGGVVTDPEDDTDEVGADDIVLEIDASPDEVDTKEDTGTDPNQFDDYQSKSEEIVDAVENSD